MASVEKIQCKFDIGIGIKQYKKIFGKGQVGVSSGRAEAVVTLSRSGGGGITTSRGSLLLQSLPIFKIHLETDSRKQV